MQRKLTGFASYYSTKGKVWTAMLSNLGIFILIKQQLLFKLKNCLHFHGPLRSTGLTYAQNEKKNVHVRSVGFTPINTLYSTFVLGRLFSY